MSRFNETMGHSLGEAFETELEEERERRSPRPTTRDHRSVAVRQAPHSPAYARSAAYGRPALNAPNHARVSAYAHPRAPGFTRPQGWAALQARPRGYPFPWPGSHPHHRFGHQSAAIGYPGAANLQDTAGPRSWIFDQPLQAPPRWLKQLLRALSAERAASAVVAPDAMTPPGPSDDAAEPVDAAARDQAPPEPAGGAGELMPWHLHALNREFEAAPPPHPKLAQTIARWNLKTGVASAPTLATLIDRYRPTHAPEVPTTLLVAFTVFEGSGWSDATHGTAGNKFTSPPFYELGVFQTPAGLHGVCSGPKHENCAEHPPGRENPADPSAWARICKRLQLNPQNWTDPTTQVRVGLTNLEDDARRIRARFPELFKQPGSDWDLRAAVLMPFVGIGFASNSLKANRAALAQLPEAERWSALKTRVLAANPGRAALYRSWFANVDKKMELHVALATHLRTGSRQPAAPVAPASYQAPPPSLSPQAGSSFVGPDVTAFASRLGAAWSKQRGGNPTPDAMRDWLLKDHQATLVGALGRYKKRYSEADISHAWMVSREQQMKFQLAAGKIPSIRGFGPPSSPVTRVTSPLIEGSNEEKVAPVVVRFVEQLRRLGPRFSAGTYARHGGGNFLSKGYSVDLFLDTRLDARGFYQPDAAVEFLRAVGKAAAAVKLEWRVLYNDYSVAEVINRENGVQRVAFIGHAAGKNVIWHGPKPLILHFHLDLGVKS